MYAVIESGGRQYRVEPGTELVVEKLDAAEGASLSFDNVLLLRGDAEGEVQVGRPYVDGVSVRGTVLAQKRARKILVQKFKRRQGYRRLQGHRQHQTHVRIDEIVIPGGNDGA